MAGAAAQAAVERACVEFQNPGTQAGAEQVLLQFRRGPSAVVLPACRHILEHSGSPDARFHAACALREALLREWASLDPGERAGMRSYILQYVLHHAGEPQLAVVRSILQGTLAVMLKRGWADASEEARAGFFQELDAAGKAVGSPAARMAALQVMEAAVSEFSLVTASPIGLSWEYHESCRNMFEDLFLQQIFRHGLVCAQQAAADAAAAPAGSEASASAAVAAAAMKLMTAVLGWDFKLSNSSLGFMTATLAGLTAAMATRKGLPDTTQVKPGAQWSELLLAPSTTDWLLQLMPAVTGQPAAAASALAAASRQLVVAFCSLAGDIFPKPPAEAAAAAAAGAAGPSTVPVAPAQVAHVVQMLRLVLPWCSPPQQVLQQALSGDEAQLVDACRALAALCAGHKPGVLDAASVALSASAQQQQQQQQAAASVFAALEGLTCCFLAAGGVSACAAPEPWVADCTEMLLECWSGLLAPQCGYNMCSVPPPQQALEGAGRTAAALIEAALADAAAGAAEDADEEEDAGAGAVHQEEWMARVAVLLRANPVPSFNRLADLLASKQQALAGAAAAGADPSVLLEQLYWLARMAAHTLADSGVGEVPLPPEAVLLAVGDTAAAAAAGASPGTGAATHRLQQPNAAAAAAAAGAAAVVRLSRALLELTALCLNPAAAPVVSPRLLEACVWSSARWADTYLFPEDEEPLPEVLGAAFGALQGAGILDMLVRVAQHCLTAFPGEAELHRQVCLSLLTTLTHRKPLTRRLLQLESWQALAAAFAARQAALSAQLSQKLQRALSRSLCLAASGFGDDKAAAAQYVSHMLLRTANELAGLAGRPQAQLAALAQQASVQLQVACLLEVLRGAALATQPASFDALCSMFSGLLHPLLALHLAFKAVTPVVALLLKLADDVVENMSLYMESGAQKEQLLNWTLQLLSQYRDSNLWQVSLQTAKALKDERAAEQCRDLRAVLNLLIHITQSDLSTTDDEPHPSGAAAVATAAPGAVAPAPAAAAADASGGGGGAGGGASNGGAQAGDGSAVSRVVLVGLNIVLPLISAELLKFPKLAHLYYSLLSYMLEVYPQAVADLPPPAFASLMASLEWGLLGSDTVAVHCSLEGLAGLSKYQYEAAQRGGRGLAGQAAGSRSVVGHFQELLLRRLLLEDTPQDLVELSAVALLPLLLSEPASFALLSASIAAAAAGPQGDARAAQAVESALAQLGSGLQGHAAVLAASQDAASSSNSMRTATRQFRQQLCQLVSDVRGLIRMR